jgi:glycosyltransferase involved in cell wall biosynthesis
MRVVYHHRTRSTDAQRIHILEIVRAFESLGHQVEIISLVHPETAQSDAERDAGEAAWKKLVRRIPWGYEAVQLGYNLVGIPMLIVGLLRKRADFIYERYSLFNFTGVFVARLFRIPIVLEVNSPFALEQKRDGDIRSFRFAMWTEKVICNAARCVVVVSSPLRRIMIESGIRPEKLVVMPNGINLDHFQRECDTGELRRRLNLRGRTVIGFVGWFRNWHGLDLLLQAFHQAQLGPQGASLMLIGDGPEMPNLRQYVEANGLADYVVFTGPLPHEQVPPYLALIDIAVQPAANEYCCPMKILEYMGMSKPMIAPRQENIEELVRDGDQGYLFTPGDVDSMASALSRLARDPTAIQSMGRRSLQAISERGYLWTSNAQRVIDVVAGAASAAPQPVASGISESR